MQVSDVGRWIKAPQDIDDSRNGQKPQSEQTNNFGVYFLSLYEDIVNRTDRKYIHE